MPPDVFEQPMQSDPANSRRHQAGGSPILTPHVLHWGAAAVLVLTQGGAGFGGGDGVELQADGVLVHAAFDGDERTGRHRLLGAFGRQKIWWQQCTVPLFCTVLDPHGNG